MKVTLLTLLLTACGLDPISVNEKDSVTETSELQIGNLSISPAILDFGQTLIGSPQFETIVFKNVATAPLSISSIYIEGDDAFTLDSSLLSFDLDGEDEEIITVQFNPVQLTTVNGLINILVESESTLVRLNCLVKV